MYSEGYEDYSRLPALPWNADGRCRLCKRCSRCRVDGGNSVYQRESHSSCCISIRKTGETGRTAQVIDPGHNYHYLMHLINLIVSN